MSCWEDKGKFYGKMLSGTWWTEGISGFRAIDSQKRWGCPWSWQLCLQKGQVQATCLFNSMCPGTPGAQYRVRSLKLFRLQPEQSMFEEKRMVGGAYDLSNQIVPRLGEEDCDQEKCSWPLDCPWFFFIKNCVAWHQNLSSVSRTVLATSFSSSILKRKEIEKIYLPHRP